jgi:iron(III) transport system permease protein
MIRAAPPAARQQAGRSRPGMRARPFAVVGWLVAAVLAATAVYALGTVVSRLVWVDGGFSAGVLRATLDVPDLAALVGRTVALVAATVVIALVAGSTLAWINERTDARIPILTDAVPLVPYLLPPVAGAIGWVLLLSPGAGFVNVGLRAVLARVGVDLTTGPLDIYSWYGLIFVFALYQVPFAFLLVSAGLRTLDPALEEQSRVCGAGPLRTLRRVTLPALAPSLGGAVLLMTWQGFALFSLPAIIGRPAGIDVLSVRIVRSLTASYPPATDVAVGLSMIAVSMVAIVWFTQSRLLRRGRYSTVGGRGTNTARLRLGHWRPVVRAGLLLYVLVAAVLPIAALVVVCLNGFWSATMRWDRFGFDPLRTTVFGNAATLRALSNSLRLGVAGATIGIVAAAVIAVVVTRSPRRSARALDAGIKLPASISNIVLAVGVLLAFAGPPFNLRGSLLILLVGYLVLYLPHGSVAADTAAGQVGAELTEASQVAGASAGRTFARIQVPLMLGGLAAGWALLFVRMTGDLTASALLAGTRNPVVGARILDVYQNGSYAEVAALSTVLVAVTGTVVGLTLAWSRRRGRWGVAPTVGGL